jgi:hypothetical protein
MAIFLYDLTDYGSFYQMEDWLDTFKSSCVKSSTLIDYAIVGTKLDLVQEDPNIRAINQGALEEWLLELENELDWHQSRVKYFELSTTK